MPVRIETITMDCRDERVLSALWTGALGYEVAVDQPGDWMVLREPSGTGPSIGLQVVPEPKVVKHRVHLDLIPSEGELKIEIRRLERLGARRVRYVENDPDELHWIMADPERDRLIRLSCDSAPVMRSSWRRIDGRGASSIGLSRR